MSDYSKFMGSRKSNNLIRMSIAFNPFDAFKVFVKDVVAQEDEEKSLKSDHASYKYR